MSKERRCCLCGGTRFFPLLQLDDLPISHYLRKRADDPDPRFAVVFEACQDCGLLQIVDPIPAHLIYEQADTYTTGFQKPRHLDDLITTAIARRDPGKVIDIGCNDGALMAALGRAGYGPVVGVEPNRVAAELARAQGQKVYASFLDRDAAGRIVAECGPFDAAYMRHVVEHVSDLEEFFGAVRALLRPGGLLVLELPEVEQGLRLGSPAILWEEHVGYYTQALAEYLLQRFGFAILDRRQYVFGGGSFAFVAEMVERPARAEAPPDPAATLELLRGFADRLRRQGDAIRELVSLARARGYKVMMYGAAPRSCLVASASGIAGMIDLVVDDRDDIQDRLMPGTDRAVRALARVADSVDDKLLCLLGVGSENEFKVRGKVEAAAAGEPVFVSLFSPRDTLQSVAEARRSIMGPQ
ncbi:methyltransferase domain-containing protein [Reyranella sp.]|uniref:methyltransferase domain-containing protein n=1 Tax=Reyranella sp. TaxID=1929291 RepID=UPI003BA923EF